MTKMYKNREKSYYRQNKNYKNYHHYKNYIEFKLDNTFHPSQVAFIKFDGIEYLVSAGNDCYVKLWNVDSDIAIATFKHHTKVYRALNI